MHTCVCMLMSEATHYNMPVKVVEGCVYACIHVCWMMDAYMCVYANAGGQPLHEGGESGRM